MTSVVIGLCMGSGAVFSIAYGAGNEAELKESMWVSFWFIGLVTVVINVLVFVYTDGILYLLQVPEELYGLMNAYVKVIFAGIGFTFLYNYFACLLRAVGNSVAPLWFLAAASILNIVLDLWFVIGLQRGVAGAAEATVMAQAAAGAGIMIYTILCMPSLRLKQSGMKLRAEVIGRVTRYSVLTCIQQSVMNFGILMIQGLVNSFGTVIMAAFAAAVKIDTLAYMPAQEFGNAFSMFVAQNYGAEKHERIKKGTKLAVRLSVGFCVLVSVLVCLSAGKLMQIFVEANETAVIAEGFGIFGLRAPFTGESAAYFCFMVYTGASKSQGCHWC